ncbi:MAG TPA: c-type cytochrome biogenesis protein CcsB, partial [Desulfurivibrionaceae bacterium]|nr:c-type cytochrome biogenesis protein CcsB [Desulfurivibrionaceae bacterium]
MGELFQLTVLAYAAATITYLVYFFSQNKRVRSGARGLLLAAGVLHTGYIVARYLASGHTPIASNHEAVSFFAWSLTWGFLSFRWRYQVKNFGAFVSPLITLLMVIAALSSQHLVELPPALQSYWLPIHAS